jgi:hypothetical protein
MNCSVENGECYKLTPVVGYKYNRGKFIAREYKTRKEKQAN